MANRIFNSNFIKIFIISFLIMTANQIIMVTLPLYLDSLGKNPSVLGTATSLSALAAMVARPISGIIADKKGRKVLLIGGSAIMLLSMLGLNIVAITVVIIIIRLVQGFGISAATTAQMAIATDVLPKSKVKNGLSYFGISGTLAAASGPFIGLALVNGDNYTWTWIGGAMIFALSILIILTLTYEKQSNLNQEITAKQKQTFWFWRYFEKTAIKPSIVQLLLAIGNTGIVFFPSYATQIGISEIGLFYTLQAVAMFVSSLSVGTIINRIRNPLHLLIPAITCYGLSYLLLFLAKGEGMFYASAIALGLGLGVTMATMSVITMAHVAYERRGAASATFLSSIDLGFSIGSLLGGIIIGSMGYRSFYGLIILFPVAAAIISSIMFRNTNLHQLGEKVIHYSIE